MNALQIPAGYPAVPIELVGASVLSLSHLHCWHPTQSDTCRSSSIPERQELPELDGKTPKMSPAEVASFPAFSGVEVRIWRITILATPRYRGGKICLDIHFAPLWRSMVHVFLHVLAKLRQCHSGMQHRCRYVVSPRCRANVPKFGISHALSLAQFLAKEKRWASSIKFDLSDLILYPRRLGHG